MSSKDPALQAYLASKYLSGAKADAIVDRYGSAADGQKRKKKKRKVEGSSGGIIVGGSGGMLIADDDGAWGAPEKDDDAEDDAPVVTETRGSFKAKSSASTWSTIREGSKPTFDPADQPYVRTPSPEPLDEAPVIVSTTNSPPPVAKAVGGLQTAADLRAEESRRAAAQAAKQLETARELAKLKAEQIARGEDPDDEANDPHATVYRDASGKRIDLKLEKAERAKIERERVEREMKKMEWGKGLVQKEDKVARKREEERLAAKPMARYADDEDMNDEMRDRDRWNDPAAAFLTKEKKKSKQTAPRFPRYAGPTPAPNRFGIAPGYRWDGVDRGNGWEAKLMQSANSRKMFNAAAHEYSTEDM